MSTLRRVVRPVPSGTAAVMTAALLASATPALAQTPAALTVDFDAAMNGLRFNQATLDANRDSTDAGNGMLDADEMALVSAILANPSLNLKARGGVDQAAVKAAFEQARESARTDLKALLGTYPTAVEVVAGYVLLGKGSFDSYSAMSAGLGAPLKSDYSQALRVGKWLAFDGDADGDGVTNLIEYKGTIAQGRAVYIKTALDPVIKPVAPAQTATGWSNALGR